jgi:hypothetical protein
LPTSSFDTFFACTILVAAALVGMAFFASTMQTRIASTEDFNKGSYLKAIADHIITSAGSPANWGTDGVLPTDFGLAKAIQTSSYELDRDKISRLSSLDDFALETSQISNAAKLSHIAIGISVRQVIDMNIFQTSNFTVGSSTSFDFAVSASINSKPTSASLHCYAVAHNYLEEINGSIPSAGSSQITVQIPSAETNGAFLIMFAKANIDDRITSYAIYNFAISSQELLSSTNRLNLSPLDYTLTINNTSPDLTVRNCYVFTYSYQRTLPDIDGRTKLIPKLIDNSPSVLVVCAFSADQYFQEWTAYPQVPLETGANFEGAQQNVFSYLITVDGVLYKLDLSLGDPPK